MPSERRPQRKDKVNDRSRGAYRSNGFVVGILYDDGPDEVIVRYGSEIVHYDYETFCQTWTDRYGGVFEIGAHDGIQSEG